MIVKLYSNSVYHFKYEYTFEGTEIEFVDVDNSAADCYVLITGRPTDWTGRYDVMKLGDDNIVGTYSIDHTGFTINPTGAIEFFMMGNQIDMMDCFWMLYDGATKLCEFGFDATQVKAYTTGNSGTTFFSNVTDGNTWYRFSVQIDIAAGVNGQYSIYIYEGATLLDSLEDEEFLNNATKVDKITIEGDTVASTVVNFTVIDCIGITAEGNYTQGDNQYFEIDVSDYMENTRIHDGIIPYKKFFYFDCHPNYHTYFNEGWFIEVFDDSNNLQFTGYIKTKSRDKKTGIYHFSCPSMTNEVFERTYDKSFSSDKTSEKLQDIIDNKLEFCYRDSSITATTIDYSYEYSRACIYMFNLARFMERQVIYIEPDGKCVSKDYDGLTATGKSWTLYDGNQNAILIDIPGLEDAIPGYYFGNTGITSVSVRYKDNTTVIRPATPTETFKKKRLKEFRDPKLQASTEANQLGDNLYNIFSKDTIFLGMQIKGEGWLQPGKTIQIENTGQITITQAHFLIVKVVYDPKNDVYLSMILSDNIITPKEFKSDLDTSRQQIHTATLQSFENQKSINNLTYYTQAEVDALLLASKQIILPCSMIPESLVPQAGYRWKMTASGHDIGGCFYLDGNIVDTSKDVEFLFIFEARATDAVLNLNKYMAATAIGAALAWNISNGGAFSMSVVNGVTYIATIWQMTFANADISDGDLLTCMLRLSDITDIWMAGIFVRFYLK